jgi:hypothetical protein
MKRGLFQISIALILLIPLNIYGARQISHSTARCGYSAIAVNQDGVILAVWVEGTGEDVESGFIYYSVFKNGDWSGPKNAGITKLLAWSPMLDVDSDGNFHIAYADGTSRLNRDIWHCVYDPNTGWDTPEMIWRSIENSAWQKIDIDGNMIHILWHHENADPYRGFDIVMQSKKVGDAYWPTAYERISYSPHELSTHPGFKVVNDRVYVVYMEGVNLQLPWRLFYKEAKSGSNWMNIPEEEICPLGYRPELDVDDGGDVHVVWSTKVGNFMYRRKDKATGTWKGQEIISNKFSPQQFGDLRYKNNLLIATWVQDDSSGRSAYYARKIVGGQWENPVQIEQGSDAYIPRVWLDDSGYAHFVWSDHGEIFYEKIAMPYPQPFLQLNPKYLSLTVEGQNPEPFNVSLKNIGEKPLEYKLQVDESWLTVTPTSGKLAKNQEDELLCTVDAWDLEEGSHTATIEVSSKEAINSPQTVRVDLDVLAPPIYAPLNFSGTVVQNKALFYIEYIHKLTWEPNPKNRNVASYMIYEVDGVNRYFLEELPASSLEYMRRHIIKGKSYTYELCAVDNKGRTGDEPATITIGAAAVSKDTEKSGRVSIKKKIIE